MFQLVSTDNRRLYAILEHIFSVRWQKTRMPLRGDVS
jgi:hypothetical protein